MRLIIPYLALMLCFFCWKSNAQDTKRPVIAVIPIIGSINENMATYFKKCMEESSEKGADIIIVNIDTYGGLLHSCDDIRKLILRSETPVWAFVDYKAGSAGAIIAISSQKIFMTKDAIIGASTVVDGNHITLHDKYQSFTRARMRSSASINGRSTKIAEMMVGYYDLKTRKDMVLTLTSEEALSSGYCEGVYKGVGDLIIKEFGLNVELIYPTHELPVFTNDEINGGGTLSSFFSYIWSKSSFLTMFIILLIYGAYRHERGKNNVLVGVVAKCSQFLIKK